MQNSGAIYQNKAQSFFPNQAIITIINKVCAAPVHKSTSVGCNGMQRSSIVSNGEKQE